MLTTGGSSSFRASADDNDDSESSSNFVDRSYTKSFDPEIFPSLGELYICDHHYHHSQVLSQIGVFLEKKVRQAIIIIIIITIIAKSFDRVECL